MSTFVTSESGTAPRVTARKFGLVGIIVASLGLAAAIFAPLAFEVQRPPPQPLSDLLADTVVKIKNRIFKKERLTPPPQTDWRVVATITASALGFIGAAFGTASWIRREDLRISGAAVVVGVLAIGFHYIMAAAGVALVCIIIGWILSHLN